MTTEQPSAADPAPDSAPSDPAPGAPSDVAPGVDPSGDPGVTPDALPDDEPDASLSDIALALFHLRRIWARPDLMRKIRAQTSAGPGGRPLQLSNLMVVHAVAALAECADGPEVTVGAVAERLEIDPSTASRLVGHAIDAGLVSRRPSPVDARRANLGLTEAGQRVRRVAERFRVAYFDELMSGWSEREKTEFARLLTRFAEAAAQSPAMMDAEGVERIFREAGAD